MNILIVEDEPAVATTLRNIIETDPQHRVTAVAVDLLSAIESVEKERPDLALIDFQLAGSSTGFSVADALNKRGVACLFSTATPPPFKMPELAWGCMPKPYGLEEVLQTLRDTQAMMALPEARDGSRC